MAFWGVEVKPGKAVPFVPPPEGSKLHLSQVCCSLLSCRPAILPAHCRCTVIGAPAMLPLWRRTQAAACSPSLSAPARCPGCLQACLSTKAKPGAKAALKVRVSDEGTQLLVCSLREGGAECLGLDLIFDQ